MADKMSKITNFKFASPFSFLFVKLINIAPKIINAAPTYCNTLALSPNPKMPTANVITDEITVVSETNEISVLVKTLNKTNQFIVKIKPFKIKSQILSPEIPIPKGIHTSEHKKLTPVKITSVASSLLFWIAFFFETSKKPFTTAYKSAKIMYKFSISTPIIHNLKFYSKLFNQIYCKKKDISTDMPLKLIIFFLVR